MTGLDLVTDALTELGVLGAAESPTPEDAAFVLRRLNQLLDSWNAERDAVYADVFGSYTLTPSLSPHTIGPTGTFVTAQRPVSIEGANLMISATVRNPIDVTRDAAWWFARSVPSLATSVPTDLYYNPTWPNGALYFWPVPTTTGPVELWTRQVLAALTLATVFTMPPAYQEALTLTLAEKIAPAFGVQVTAQTTTAAATARARVFNNNRVIPKLVTRDSGIPGARGTWNYLTGQWF